MLGGGTEERRRADVRLLGLWKHARAVLVLGHVLTMVLIAIPAPVGGTDRAMWKNPTAQMEFATYANFLRMPPAEFEEKLYQLAMFWMGIRDVYLRPVWPYMRVTGTDQPWRMFVGPDRFPPRFQLQFRTAAADFATLYEERSAVFTWHEDYFRQERVRSHTYRYAWPGYWQAEVQNCNYLARLVFEEKPDATVVRCRFWKQKTPSAEQVLAASPLEPGSWEQVTVVPR